MRDLRTPGVANNHNFPAADAWQNYPALSPGLADAAPDGTREAFPSGNYKPIDSYGYVPQAPCVVIRDGTFQKFTVAANAWQLRLPANKNERIPGNFLLMVISANGFSGGESLRGFSAWKTIANGQVDGVTGTVLNTFVFYKKIDGTEEDLMFVTTTSGNNITNVYASCIEINTEFLDPNAEPEWAMQNNVANATTVLQPAITPSWGAQGGSFSVWVHSGKQTPAFVPFGPLDTFGAHWQWQAGGANQAWNFISTARHYATTPFTPVRASNVLQAAGPLTAWHIVFKPSVTVKGPIYGTSSLDNTVQQYDHYQTRALLINAQTFYRVLGVQNPGGTALEGYTPTIVDEAESGGNGASAVITLPTNKTNKRVFGVLYWNLETAAPTFPGGWTVVKTQLVAFTDTWAASYFYRDCDGTEGASITVTNASTVARDWTAQLVSFDNFDPNTAPEVSAGATLANNSSINPDAITPSWGGARRAGFLAVGTWNDSGKGVGNTTNSSLENDAPSWPFTTQSGYVRQTAIASGRKGHVAFSYQSFVAVTIDPSRFSLSSNDDWAAATVAILGKPSGVAAPFVPSVNQFYTPHKISLRVTVGGVVPSSNSFFTPVKLVRNFGAPFLGSSNSFFTPHKIILTVKPTRADSSNQFYGPTVITGTNIFPSKLNSSNAFFGPKLILTVKPNLLGSSNAIFNPAVANLRTVLPSPVASGNQFFAPSVTVTTVSLKAPPVGTIGAGFWKALDEEYRWKRPRRKKPVDWELPKLADLPEEGPPFRPMVVTPEAAREAAKRQVQFARRAQADAKARERKATTARALDDLATNVIVRVIFDALKDK